MIVSAQALLKPDHHLPERFQVDAQLGDERLVAVEAAPPQLLAHGGQRRAVQADVPPLSAGQPHAALGLLEHLARIVVDVGGAQLLGVDEALVFAATVLADEAVAVKRLQLDANVCCDTVEMDATPVIAAVLDACEALLGAGARKVLAGVLPEIRTIPVKRAESLSFDEMEQARFQELFDGLTEYIGDHYTHVMLDDARAEFWNMAGRNRRVA